MKSILPAVVFVFVLISLPACVVTPGPPGRGGAVVAPLPVVVELGADRHYYHDGYYYFYQNNNWRYSRSQNGPWADLPRSHWPKEIKYKKRVDDKHRDGGKDRDGYDDRRYRDTR
ncbi:MAG TPA: hypothetical protein PLI53_03970 [Geobacteraceae bacterium]|nr:hypothetical protein [Geobacteraceae bacterium]